LSESDIFICVSRKKIISSSLKKSSTGCENGKSGLATNQLGVLQLSTTGIV